MLRSCVPSLALLAIRFVEGFAKIVAPLHRLAAEFSGGKPKPRKQTGLKWAMTEDLENTYWAVSVWSSRTTIH